MESYGLQGHCTDWWIHPLMAHADLTLRAGPGWRCSGVVSGQGAFLSPVPPFLLCSPATMMVARFPLVLPAWEQLTMDGTHWMEIVSRINLSPQVPASGILTSDKKVPKTPCLPLHVITMSSFPAVTPSGGKTRA